MVPFKASSGALRTGFGKARKLGTRPGKGGVGVSGTLFRAVLHGLSFAIPAALVPAVAWLPGRQDHGFLAYVDAEFRCDPDIEELLLPGSLPEGAPN